MGVGRLHPSAGEVAERVVFQRRLFDSLPRCLPGPPVRHSPELSGPGPCDPTFGGAADGGDLVPGRAVVGPYAGRHRVAVAMCDQQAAIRLGRRTRRFPELDVADVDPTRRPSARAAAPAGVAAALAVRARHVAPPEPSSAASARGHGQWQGHGESRPWQLRAGGSSAPPSHAGAPLPCDRAATACGLGPACWSPSARTETARLCFRVGLPGALNVRPLPRRVRRSGRRATRRPSAGAARAPRVRRRARRRSRRRRLSRLSTTDLVRREDRPCVRTRVRHQTAVRGARPTRPAPGTST